MLKIKYVIISILFIFVLFMGYFFGKVDIFKDSNDNVTLPESQSDRNCGPSNTEQNNEDGDLISVVTHDSALIPIAVYKEGEWKIPDKGTKVPENMILYSRNCCEVDPSTISVDRQIDIDVAGNGNLGFSTKTGTNRAVEDIDTLSIEGVAFNKYQERLSFNSDCRLQYANLIKESLGLINNYEDGEAHRSVEDLGYFQVGDMILGIFLQNGYESHSYVIAEINGKQGKVIQSIFIYGL